MSPTANPLAREKVLRGIKALSNVSNARGLGKLALVLLAVAASVGTAAAARATEPWEPWLLWAVGPVCALLCVWAQHAAAEEVHDGVHYRLLADRRANDRLAEFYCSLVGVSFAAFRAEHLLHHRHFGTPEDPDYPKYATKPSGLRGWLRYAVWNFCGLAAAARLLGVGCRRSTPATRGPRFGQHPLGTAAVQLGLWGATAAVAGPWWYPLCWALPLVTLTYGMTQFRTLLEHWHDPAENGGRVGGLYNLDGPILRNVFAAQYGYNYHATHHHYPSLPNYNLERVDASITQELAMDKEVKTQSYLSRVRDVLWPRRKAAPTMDSGAVAAEVARGGTLRFYWNTFLKSPGKIVRGLWDTATEAARFLLWPRVRIGVGLRTRFWLLRRFVWAELKIPGGTTTLETIWLAYGAASATAASRDWAEVGCFKGLSSARLSLLCQVYDQHLYVYDTFEGLPGSDAVYEATDGGVAYHFQAGSYAGSEAEVRAHVAAHGCPDRVTTVRGDVRDSLRDRPLPAGLRFAFLDVDLVESYRSCFSGLAASVRPGTVIMIHEACYKPIRELIEDGGFWASIDCPRPAITYVADAYGIRSCRNLAILKWGGEVGAAR